MKLFRRILLALTILLMVILAAAAILPIVFKDRLITTAKTAINENLNARVDFSDVSLSLFRHFPDLTFGLRGFTLDGVDRFEGVRLAEVGELALTLDLFSLISAQRPITVKHIQVNRPSVDIRVLSDGAANYLIAKTAPADQPAPESSGSDFLLALDRYEIREGALRYDDRQLNMAFDLQDLWHSGSGALTSMVYDLDTKTSIGAATVDYGGIRYLNQAEAQLNAILHIDQNEQKYTLKDNDLVVNALRLIANGFLQLQGDDILLDLDVNAPENDFRNLLSLVPGAYLEGYEDVKAEGEFDLQASVNGVYSAARSLYPAFRAAMQVKDGAVQYPDLPLGIGSIVAEAAINSPGTDLDDLVVDIPTFRLRIGDNPIAGRFRLKTPLSDPNVDTDIDGTLDLAELAQAFPIPGLETMRGKIVADVQAKAAQSQIERGDYSSVDMGGKVQASDIYYKSAGLPAVEVRRAAAAFSPRYVAVEEADLQLGQSDLQASGRIDNILAYFSPEKTMTGSFTVRSYYFNVNEWMPQEEATGSGNTSTGSSYPSDTEIFDRFDFSLDGAIGQLDYGKYQIEDIVAKGSIAPNRLQVDRAALRIGDSDLALSGTVRDLFSYLFADGALSGVMSVSSNRLDLNQFMTDLPASGATGQDTDTASSQGYGVILIPQNVELTLNAKVGELTYTDLAIRDLQGALEVAESAVALQGVEGKTLGGVMKLSGMYDTQDPAEPAYSLKYDLERMGFQPVLQALNSFRQLAPISQFIEGIFSTSLMVEGTMGQDMFPKLSTLNAKGFLETIDGAIAGFPPLQKVGQTLQIKELKEKIPLKNTRNWLEIANGMVEVKPFDFEVDGIPLTIAGSHGLNRQMNYNVRANIPRNRLEGNAVGAAATEGLKAIQSEAAKLGIDIARGENVNVLINLTGALADPQIKIRFLGMDGEATSFEDAVASTVEEKVEAGKDSLRARAEAEVEAGKQRLEKETEKVVDTAKAVVDKELQKAREEAGKKAEEVLGKGAGKLLDTLLGDKGKGVLDSLAAKKEVEDLKKQLEQFNPFKKKKKTEPVTPPRDTVKRDTSNQEF